MTKLEHEREQWERDLQERGRNIVFPDTVANERRFWEHVVSGKSKLTAVQVIGLALIAFALIFTLAVSFRIDWWASGSARPWYVHALREYGGYALALCIVYGFLVIMKVVVTRGRR